MNPLCSSSPWPRDLLVPPQAPEELPVHARKRGIGSRQEGGRGSKVDACTVIDEGEGAGDERRRQGDGCLRRLHGAARGLHPLAPVAPPPQRKVRPVVLRQGRLAVPIGGGQGLPRVVRVSDICVDGGRGGGGEASGGAVPPGQQLPSAPGPGGPRRGAPAAVRAGVRAGRVRARGERVDRGETQPGDLPRADHADHHAPRHGDAPPRRPPVGLVRQPQRLGLPPRHPGRFDGGLLAAAEGPQLHTAHQPPGLEDLCRKKRVQPVILDTALYEADRSELLRPSRNITSNRRSLPSSFKLFTGSAWTMLSRRFAEYCVVGWDNLPRTLLLYHANLVSSPEFYFQTVACNSGEFRNTTVNSDLHFIRWDTPPKQHPLNLGPKDYRRMVLSSAAFARKFKHGNLVLDRIDREILKRRPPPRDDDDDEAPPDAVASPRRGGQFFSYGGWCSESGVDLCSNPREPDRKGVIKAGAGSRRLTVMLNKMLSQRNFRKQQCR